MSAAGRTPGLRSKDDNYATAPWSIYRLLEAVACADSDFQLPNRRGALPSYWLEPCAGSGNIIRAVNGWYAHDWSDEQANIRWHACEIRQECEEALKAIANPVIIGDFLKVVPAKYDVVITNPPYSLAEEFLRACLPIADHVIMLLRLNWLEGRNEIWATNPADIWVLPNRIPFGRNKHGKVGTDATAYAWMHWHKNATGRLRMLERTPKPVRSEYRRYLDMTLPKRSDDGRDAAVSAGGDQQGSDGVAEEVAPQDSDGSQPLVAEVPGMEQGAASVAPSELPVGAAEGVRGGDAGSCGDADEGRDAVDRGGSANAGGLQAAAEESVAAEPAGPDSFGGSDYPCCTD